MKLLVSALLGFFVSLESVDALAYGENTNSSEHPYFVAITYYTNPPSSGTSFCPGTIISPSLVVTSLSCISAGLVDLDAFTDRSFSINRCNLDKYTSNIWDDENLWELTVKIARNEEFCQRVQVYRVMHPQEYEFSFGKGYIEARNNFAILETKDRVFEDENILPICSPREYFNIDRPSFTWLREGLQHSGLYDDDRELWIVSIGYNIHGKPAYSPTEQRVEFWYNKSGNGCGKYKGFTPWQPEPDAGVCTKAPGLCLHDSGAPLILKGKNVERCLFGVASHSLIDRTKGRTAEIAISECYGFPFCAWYYQDVFMVPHKFLECPIFYGFAEDALFPEEKS